MRVPVAWSSHGTQTIIVTPIAAVGLAACGSSPGTPTARPTLAPTATPVPTASPTPVPTPPSVVTALRTGAAVQLSLVGEDGSVAATVDHPGGADGDTYFVGSDHVYFVDRTAVKAIGRDGTRHRRWPGAAGEHHRHRERSPGAHRVCRVPRRDNARVRPPPCHRRGQRSDHRPLTALRPSLWAAPPHPRPWSMTTPTTATTVARC